MAPSASLDLLLWIELHKVTNWYNWCINCSLVLPHEGVTHALGLLIEPKDSLTKWN